MTKNKSLSPIGVFDSGIGGLTVTKALLEKLPYESVIYFGDTAHLPYGDKSRATIQSYCLNIVDILLERECKLILVACGTASAAAFEAIKTHVDGRALLMNVIDPVVEYLHDNHVSDDIGLIATRFTVNSDVYKKKLEALAFSGSFNALAAPLLVPIIEEGFSAHQIADLVLAEYLAHPKLQNIDALVLGCTHYPVIKKSIVDFYSKANRPDVDIIEVSHIVAETVKNVLTANNLLSNSSRFGTHKFYVSDYTDAFANMAKMFFGEDIKLEFFKHN